MTFKKPFHRTYRPVTKNEPTHWYSSWWYIIDRNYSQNPEHYIRWFLLIQEDLQKLFEYIEPSDINLKTYSFRIHELFMRTCIETEANFKSILRENNYTPLYQNWPKKWEVRDENKWKISDYKKVNETHFLSEYSVEFPIWSGEWRIFHPFKEWEDQDTLSWYEAYNTSKHDRHGKFLEANFENLLWAVCGLFVLLSSQFRTENFSSWERCLAIEWNIYNYHQWESWIWGYLLINFPDYKEDTLYNFNWLELMKESERFLEINYNNL